MGNCIGTDMFSLKKKIPLRSLEGVEEEDEVVSVCGRVKPLARDVRPKSGEDCCLIPVQIETHSGRAAGKDSRRGRRVKIVVSKQQLEQLIRRMKKIPCSRVTAIQPFRIRRRKRYQKWRPSLDTIPEL